VDSRTVIDLLIAAAAVLAAFVAFERRVEDDAPAANSRRSVTDASPRLPGISVGSAVLSASPGAEDGGDIVDFYELDARFALLLVADVSGKGLAAAAQTAFIKYTIRTLALENDSDPAVVMAKFNAIYYRTVTDHESFVVLILGIIDSQTGDLRYASAGHEPAFVRRRDGRIVTIEPTGPIVGVAPYSAYRSDSLTLDRGDVLVWTTDGMTESRDRKRRLLGVEGLAGWIAGAPADPLGVADWLVASLKRRSGAVEDDVAVLAVAYAEAPPRPAPAARRFLAVPHVVPRGRLRDRQAF
jgi:sigma-B regulation protein RsbU (phosphoserine phosphatase)